MGTVGQCDDLLRSLLLSTYGRSPAAAQKDLADALDRYVQESLQHQEEQYATYNAFEEKLASRAVTSYHLQRLTLHITKGKESYRDQRKVLARFYEEVLKPRNILGHAAETRTDQGWTVTSSGNSPIGTQDFPRLRRDMATHLSNVVRPPTSDEYLTVQTDHRAFRRLLQPTAAELRYLPVYIGGRNCRLRSPPVV